MQQVVRFLRSSTLTMLVLGITTLSASANESATEAATAPSITNPDAVNGIYRSVDDKTGFSRGLTEVTLRDGVLHGTIIKTIPRPNYTPKKICTGCPAPFTNQPIMGLDVFVNMKLVAGKNDEYKGKILDPVSGNLYSGHIKLSRDARKLKLRGYVGLPIMGRTQWWVREEHPERY
jgi:uncharacterized protein (DUF2147 family)